MKPVIALCLLSLVTASANPAHALEAPHAKPRKAHSLEFWVKRALLVGAGVATIGTETACVSGQCNPRPAAGTMQVQRNPDGSLKKLAPGFHYSEQYSPGPYGQPAVIIEKDPPPAPTPASEPNRRYNGSTPFDINPPG